MTVLFKFSCLIIVITALACSSPAKKNIYDHHPEISSLERPMQIEPDTAGTVKFDDFKQVPVFIRHYLDSLEGGKYLIANPGESFAAGCTSFEGEPRRQLIWAALNKYSFRMQYWQGGIALFKCSLTIHLKENKMVSYSSD